MQAQLIEHWSLVINSTSSTSPLSRGRGLRLKVLTPNHMVGPPGTQHPPPPPPAFSHQSSHQHIKRRLAFRRFQGFQELCARKQAETKYIYFSLCHILSLGLSDNFLMTCLGLCFFGEEYHGDEVGTSSSFERTSARYSSLNNQFAISFSFK